MRMYQNAQTLLKLAAAMQGAADGITLAGIMEIVPCGYRTAQRLARALEEMYPQADIHVDEEGRKHWRLPAGTLGRELAVTAEELAALSLAGERLAAEGRADVAGALSSLEHKLKAWQKPDGRRRLETDVEALLEAEGLACRPGPVPLLDREVVEALRQAVLSCRQVRIDYTARTSGKTSFQTVHPYGFLHGHRHYLVAYNTGSEGVRLFSLANVGKVTPLDSYFERPADFDLQSYAARTFGVFSEEPVDVVWKFRPEAAAEAKTYRFHPNQTMEEMEDGSLIVRFTAGGQVEMAWHLFKWGDLVEVLEPRSLADLITPYRPHWGFVP